MKERTTQSLRVLALSYAAVYFSEGSFRSLGIFLPLYLRDPTLGFNVTAGEIAFIIAMAYIAWNFKFILGLLIDLTPMIHRMRRRLWILMGQIFRVLGILIIMATTNLWIIFLGALIALTGDAFVDIGADALLIDVAPPDWHGLGLGGGWAARAIGYALSSIVTTMIVIAYGWFLGWLIFIVYSLPVIMMLFLSEPPLVRERRFSKEVFARTFSDIRASTSFFFLAFFGGAAYALDPNRGLLGEIVRSVLGLGKPATLSGYLEQIPIVGATMAAFAFAAAIGAFFMGAYTDRIGHRKGYYISLTGFLLVLSLWLVGPTTIGKLIASSNPELYGVVILSSLLGFFEGWNFVAWEALIADYCPPQMSGFVFQYGMTGTHFSAFLVAVVVGPLLDIYGGFVAISVSALIVAIGYVPVMFMVPFRTSKVTISIEGE